MNFPEKIAETRETGKADLIEYSGELESEVVEKIKKEGDIPLRRKMLRKVAVWGILTMLAVGAPEIKAQEKGSLAGGEKTENVKDNEHDREKELKGNEHIIPDAVLLAFHQVVDKNTPPEVGGTYVYKNFLDTKEKENEFEGLLKKEGFTERQIDTFNSYLTAEQGIVLSESDAANREKFNEVLFHERIHEAMHGLDREDLDSLKAAYDDVVNHPGIKKYDKLLGKYYEESFLWDRNHGFDAVLATMNWDEFYPYLANGKFVPRVEEEIRNAHPGAYKIFKQMEQMAKVELPK